MNRLRSYRRIRQITQKELAERLGMSASSVSAMESGRRAATCDITLLGYGPERMRIPDMTEPLHRHRASTPVRSKNRAKELLRLAGEIYPEMRASLGGRQGTWLDQIGPPQGDTDIVEMAREARIGVLSQEENMPISNLTRAAERAGICLIPIVNQKGIDGVSSWVGDQPVIALNINVPGDRFRLSLAHEIGHLVMHRKQTPDSEREAYRFASALLMDDDDFEAAMPNRRPVLRDFVALKSSWGISAAALVYRARLLGFLDDRSFRSLQIQMSRWRNAEPRSFPPVYGNALPWMVERGGGIKRCSINMGINADHLRMLITWIPRHLSVA